MVEAVLSGVIALIDDPGVVRRILEHTGHLERWAREPAERGPTAQAPNIV